MSRRPALPLLLLLLGCVAPGCGGERARSERLEAARDRALGYFAREVHRVDPSWASLFGYLHRRFGLEARNAEGALLRLPPEHPSRPEIAAVYRRLSDPAATVSRERIAALPSPIDRMTGLALHCDRIGLPPDWPAALRRASEAGGYALSHAALASEWTLENGCRSPADMAAVQHFQVERLVAVAQAHGDMMKGFRAPTDFFAEALAMLYYLHAGSRVEPAWIDALLQMQRADGGWPLRPDAPASNPHATALALWVVLENLQPEAPPIHWIP